MPEATVDHAPVRSERSATGTTVVAPHGDLDLLSAPPLSARLDTLTAGPRPDVVLDLRAVSFIDCSGLGVLCRARNRALARQGRLRLVADSAHFLRIVRHVGLDGVFDIMPRLPETLGVAGARRA
ncbi:MULTISPECIES: STAS domain-containing protein [unclassified Streptomyces]|uniref:STAS domain-containing protein n=1 Tax=unclassified Streptomyces TaxID=2593676 RepID=UPI001F046983|nr:MULTISPECIES: STAS domain-containing protein [unclassified Streptomyces]MCH0562271.1 STAS domain-containing protein [Streptomyces sp. MUM 2J]MCH0573213.1 STAS domain-containing protein [Streptomyces sp. MUM 136J]